MGWVVTMKNNDESKNLHDRRELYVKYMQRCTTQVYEQVYKQVYNKSTNKSTHMYINKSTTSLETSLQYVYKQV